MIAEWLSFIFFSFGGIVHLVLFIMESVLFQRKGGHRLFGTNEADYSAVKVWAFSQGFYNLFLALGTFVGLSFVLKKQVMLAGVLTGFCGLSMLVAGIVLWLTSPQLRKWAFAQAIPPLLGFLFLYFHITGFFTS
jgi:putative membrane protein